MLFNGVTYILAETIKSLYRNKWMSIASVGVVVATLFMLGAFMLVSFNITHITDTVKSQVEIVVFVDDEAQPEQQNMLQTALFARDDLSEVRFISREEALKQMQSQLGSLLEGYDPAESPLRDSYKIRAVLPESVPDIAREIEAYPAVGDVFYGRGVVENLFNVTRVLQLVALGLMTLLAVTAVFLIAHTIKLTVYIRSSEIMIMKYVGATNWFIRWPFVLEGLALGSLGAFLPLIALNHIYRLSVEWAGNNLVFLNLLPAPDIMLELAKYLVPLGTGLGILGSSLSLGRFLKV